MRDATLDIADYIKTKIKVQTDRPETTKSISSRRPFPMLPLQESMPTDPQKTTQKDYMPSLFAKNRANAAMVSPDLPSLRIM